MKGRASALHSQIYLRPFEQQLRLTPRSDRIRKDILEHKPLSSLSPVPALPKLPIIPLLKPHALTHRQQSSMRFNAISGCAREIRNEFKLLVRPRKSLSLRRLPRDLHSNRLFNWETAAKLLASKELLYQEQIRDTYASLYSHRRNEAG